jgi:hypothetical protein
MTTKRIVFYVEGAEDWAVFYTLGDEILGVVLSKLECPTLEDFKRELPSCEDAPVPVDVLIGARIVAVEEVE